MKKTLSLVLALIMALCCFAPAYASDEVMHTVNFVQPSGVAVDADAYVFAYSENGYTQYIEDDNGIYVLYEGRFMTMDNIFEQYQPVDPQYYSPYPYEAVNQIADGTTLVFKVVTSPKYNAATAQVFVNGSQIFANTLGEYTVYVDRDLTINIGETDENNQPALLLNHYNVTLTSGDGYKVRTLANENYGVVFYGGEFYFRIKVSSGYSASGMKVYIARGDDMLAEYIGDEFDVVGNIMGKNELISSYGTDSEGCKLYKISDITTDCKVIVSGVREESSNGILAIFKRIIRLICNLLNIQSPFVENLVGHQTVTVETQGNIVEKKVNYRVITSTENAKNLESFEVGNGESVSLQVTTEVDPVASETVNTLTGEIDYTYNISVSWTPGNETATYQVVWQPSYNAITNKLEYSAVFNIDAISVPTAITITA